MEDFERKAKTVMLIMVWISMGLCLEIPGPTLIDMKITFNANYEELTRSVSARGVGIFLGALFAGLFVDVLGPKKDWLVTLSQALFTVTMLSIPFVGSLSTLWFLFFVLGAAAGTANVAGQRILLEMWREKSASPMHAIHMGFGVGALFAPLIANPFLAVLQFTSQNSTSEQNETVSTLAPVHYGSDTYYIIRDSRVHLAYITIGVISFVISLPFFIYPPYKCFTGYDTKRNYYNVDDKGEREDESPRTLKQLINPATYAAGSLKYGLFVFIWVLLYFINLVGGEQLFGNFIRTFSVDQLKFARDEASYLDTVFWGSFTIGRFTGSVLSHFITIKRLFPIDVAINLLAVTFLDIFSTDSHAALWIFTIIVGVTIAPLYPAAMSYVNTQIQVGGIVLTIVVFATGAGDFLYVWLAGHLYDTYGPRTVLYAIQVSAISVFILALILLICGHFHGNRFENEGIADEVNLEYTSFAEQENSVVPIRKTTQDQES